MIKGEIIAMENRLHGCVFVIVIGGIDIIKPKTIERTECRYRYYNIAVKTVFIFSSVLMSSKNLEVFASTDRGWFQNVKST